MLWESRCGSNCVCFQKLPSLSSTPRKFSADWELKRQKDKRGKTRGGRGIPANVSSRHKQRKLATLLFLIVEVQTIHVHPHPHPPGFCCRGLQMLDPAVGLLSHTDLQPFQHPSKALNGLWSLLCLLLCMLLSE